MKTNLTSPRFDLARIYFLNVRDIYEQYYALANVIAKRIRKGLQVDVNVLAESSALSSLASKLNLYSCKHDGVRCVEHGDMVALAQYVIEEANEIISFES